MLCWMLLLMYVHNIKTKEKQDHLTLQKLIVCTNVQLFNTYYLFKALVNPFSLIHHYL